MSQKEQVSSKDHFEAKTALKVKSKKKLSMDQLATPKQKYSLKDMRTRHASETAKTKKEREKQIQICLTSLAHFLLYCKHNSEVLENSVKYLFELSQRYPIPKTSLSIFSL